MKWFPTYLQFKALRADLSFIIGEISTNWTSTRLNFVCFLFYLMSVA